MTYSFTRTREQVADMVAGKLGVKDADMSIASADQTLIIEAIDLRLKEMHRLGIFWRNVEEMPLSFTISANTTQASATADVLFPISLHVVNGNDDDPVRLISPVEYAHISNKAEGGVPLKAMHNGGATFTFWPVPTANTTAKLLYETVADDTAASTAPDVDVAMMRWLKDIIAYDLGDHFGMSEQKMMRWAAESKEAEKNIRKLSVPKVDYSAVAVDDYEYRESRNKRDWDT